MEPKEKPNYHSSDRPYKSKYICTTCRKSFKRKLLADITKDKNVEEKSPKCPDCGNATNWIGAKFRAPKSDNIQAWNSITVLHDIGVLTFVGWSDGVVKIPETKKALNDILIDTKKRYESSLQMWVTNEYSPDNKKEIKFLSDRIKLIDKHLKAKH